MEKFLNNAELLIIAFLDRIMPMEKIDETPVLVDVDNNKPVYKFREWFSGTEVMAHHSWAWFRVNIENKNEDTVSWMD